VSAETIRELPGHFDKVKCVAVGNPWNEKGDRYVVSAAREGMMIWDVKTKKRIHTITYQIYEDGELWYSALWSNAEKEKFEQMREELLYGATQRRPAKSAAKTMQPAVPEEVVDSDSGVHAQDDAALPS
jgi:hypothetical protein